MPFLHVLAMKRLSDINIRCNGIGIGDRNEIIKKAPILSVLHV